MACAAGENFTAVLAADTAGVALQAWSLPLYFDTGLVSLLDSQAAAGWGSLAMRLQPAALNGTNYT